MPQKQPPASVATVRLDVAFDSSLSCSKSGRYRPYPSASSFSTGMKRRAAELMQ